MENAVIKIRKLNKNAIIPKRGSEYAAGADLFACLDNDVIIAPGETKFITTGISGEIPNGYAGFVFARSGLASKSGIAPANKVGVIDSDYRGEFIVSLYNHSQTPVTITHGQRVAQLVILPVVFATYVEADELSSTGRGDGGFGSTGK